MKPGVGTHLVGWFLSSSRDTNTANDRFAAVWFGGSQHLFTKEEFLHGFGQNLCHSEEMSG